MIDTSGGLSAHSGGWGTVGSLNRAFCIDTLAALDLNTSLVDFSRRLSERPEYRHGSQQRPIWGELDELIASRKINGG